MNLPSQMIDRHEPRRDIRPRLSSRRRSIGRLLDRAVTLLWSTLREIFDESAYDRFLRRKQMLSSAETYAAFLRETESVRQRRPRCC